MRNVLVVLSGPSGVGKGTIAKQLVKKNKDIKLSISCTTRLPREGEVDGREYFFITKDQFDKKIKDNGFLEYSNHFENFYGTPKDFVTESLKANDVLLEIDVNGGLEVKKSFNDAVLIMVAPPTLDELKKRLISRGSESEEKINMRMQRITYELDKSKMYDYIVVNDDLEDAISKVEKIIEKEKNKI